MLLGLAFTALPTVLLYQLLDRLPPFQSRVFKLTLAWFLGQYLSTIIIFVLSIALATFTDRVLFKASALWLIVLAAAIPVVYRPFDWRAAIHAWRASFPSGAKLAALAFCLGFAILLFSRHLLQAGNQIYTSPTYWDFNVHFPVIQTFVHGDNFPPENESFAGFPMTYHYFFDLLTAIYAGLGMELVVGMNYVSAMAFFMMLVAIIGLSEELLLSWKIGFVAVVLTLTSSSLRFIPFLTSRPPPIDPWELVIDVFSNRAHPYFFSFVDGNLFGYNGTMFNLFYFVAERQMIMGVIFFLCCTWLLYRRQSFSPALLVTAGALIGLFLQWHLFLTISVVAAASFLLVFGAGRRETALILLGALPVLGVQYLYFSALTSTPLFFPDVKSFPRLSFDYPTMPSYPLSPANAAGYYFFAYGAKLILAPLGFYFLARKHPAVALVLAAVILPTFLLVNTIQISPLSVWDNHKWLRPMNVVLDLVIAYVVLHGLFLPRRIYRQAATILLLPVLVASGIMELMPLLNSRPTNVYASYPSPVIDLVRRSSEPRATFLTMEAKELHLAGRKIFAPNSSDEPGAVSLVDAAKMNRAPRDRAAHEIYTAADTTAFCTVTARNGVDFVEFNMTRMETPLFGQLANFPRFAMTTEAGHQVTFINARAGCRTP